MARNGLASAPFGHSCFFSVGLLTGIGKGRARGRAIEVPPLLVRFNYLLEAHGEDCEIGTIGLKAENARDGGEEDVGRRHNL